MEPLGSLPGRREGVGMEAEVKNRMWAIGGGKGGVGKSVVTIMLGTMLARKGKKVVLVDADLGGSNLHTLAGIKYPLYTLADFIHRRVNKIEDVLMSTSIDNLQIICGADDILGLANPKHTQKERLLNNLNKIDADLILLDLGAGTSFTAMDFFLYAPNKIVVLTPQITSIQNAYGFIKSSMYRLLARTFNKDFQSMKLIKQLIDPDDIRIDSMDRLKNKFMKLGNSKHEKLVSCLEQLDMGLIVNMVRGNKEGNVGCIVQNVASDYLSLYPEYLGYINYDRVLESSINNMGKYLKNCIESTAGACFYDIAYKIISKSNQDAEPEPVSARVQMSG